MGGLQIFRFSKATRWQPLLRSSGAVMNRHNALLVRAMSAAEVAAACFDTVANYFTTAVTAFGRQSMDGAFETIKVARDSSYHYFDWLVILVSTNFALCHKMFSFV
jgi:hypothetical protein